MILQISACQVARIIGMSHQCPNKKHGLIYFLADSCRRANVVPATPSQLEIKYSVKSIL
jgi:hypothetical protein